MEHLFKVSWNALRILEAMIVGFADAVEFSGFDSCNLIVDVLLTLFVRCSKKRWTPQAQDFGPLSGAGDTSDHFTLLEKSELIGTYKEGEVDHGSVGSRAFLVQRVAAILRCLAARRKARGGCEVWKCAMERQAKECTGTFTFSFSFLYFFIYLILCHFIHWITTGSD